MKSKNAYRVFALKDLRHLLLPSFALLNSSGDVSIAGNCPTPASLQIESITSKKNALLTRISSIAFPDHFAVEQPGKYFDKVSVSKAFIMIESKKAS